MTTAFRTAMDNPPTPLDQFDTEQELDPALKWAVRPDGPLGPCLHHPFDIEIGLFEQLYPMINARFRSKYERIKNELATIQPDINQIISFTERPYRVEAMKYLRTECVDPDANLRITAAARWVWMDTENAWEEDAFWRATFRSGNAHAMMDDHEHARWAACRDVGVPLTVYRGECRPPGAGLRTPIGLSWTRSRQRAEWFASRYSRPQDSCVVMRAVVPPTAIAAVFDGRGEEEVVCPWLSRSNIVGVDLVNDPEPVEGDGL